MLLRTQSTGLLLQHYPISQVLERKKSTLDGFKGDFGERSNKVWAKLRRTGNTEALRDLQQWGTHTTRMTEKSRVGNGINGT